MTKNRWVVKSYGEFHHDAANISHNDLPYLHELLEKEGYDERLNDYPFLQRLISANVTPLDESRRAPTPYVIRELDVTRGPVRTLRVAIVGLTEARPVSLQESLWEYAGFKIEDPFEAARRVIPEAKQQADFVIVLAYMPQEQAQKLATENPEIDTIIGARKINGAELQRFNRATIAYAYNETKYLGELRVYMRADGSIENQVNRFVSLDDAIPDDPKAARMVVSAHDEYREEHNRRSLGAGGK